MFKNILLKRQSKCIAIWYRASLGQDISVNPWLPNWSHPRGSFIQ